ncbi:hypothetical protein J2T17_007830 [Paenibacillus mucilaginosus]|uniref:helix-turn-helix domain-containing protein n=1 Tax=Paenibacillus mucilaginosus TaxID=61624 RepID=UPI003D1DA104
MSKELLQDKMRVFVVPVEILEVPDLSIYEKMAYIVIRSHANVRDASAFPSYATIAKEGSMSRRKAIDAVAMLIEKGLLRKEIRLDVSKNRKIRNTSNLYYIEHPTAIRKDEIPPAGACGAPPLVHHMHQGGAPHAPEHNHLTESFRNMYVCMNASNEIATAAESTSISPDPIYKALQEEATGLYIDNGINLKMPEAQHHLIEIYTMLYKKFPRQLDVSVIKTACNLFIERTLDMTNPVPGGWSFKMNLRNPAGFFYDCYKDALYEYKAQKSLLKQKRATSCS